MYYYCYILNLFVTLYQAHVDLEAVDTAKDAVDAIQAHIDAIMENLIDRVRSKEDLESHISGLADSALECLDKFL